MSDSSSERSGEAVWTAVVSPMLVTEATPSFNGPTVDRLLFAASSRLQVISCRQRGAVEALVEEYGRDPERCDVPVLIAADEFGRLPVSGQTLPASAVRWIVQPFERGDERRAAETRRVDPDAPGLAVLERGPLEDPDDWLLHWTRAPRGAWPDESEEDVLDAWILGCSAEDRGAAATLLRILSAGCLRASSEGIRGGSSVVSFTEVPLQEFRKRRVWRRHRQRFDFEPWGIAIRRDAVTRAAGRPVVYGDDETWNNLTEADRPYFQKATADGITDTLAEREWRVAGDVKFGDWPTDQVCVFVDSVDSAAMFRGLCSWPVIVVPL